MTDPAAGLRVCFFIASLGDGGAQRQCVALLNALQHRSDLDLHLILLARGEYEADLETARLTIHRTDVDDFGSPGALAFVIRSLHRVKPDLLISWLHPADVWSYAATRVLRGIPWIMTERGSAYPDRGVYRLRRQLGVRGPSAIVANSPAGARVWVSHGARAPIRVIPNMVLDTKQPPSTHADKASATDCLVVARLEAQKNVPAITAAFSRFAAYRPQALLRIVGKGSEADEVARIAGKAGMKDRVALLGFRSDVPELMADARLLLSFSRFEGMPNVLMEAVRAGLPAVVSDIPEHRDLLGDAYPYYVPLDAPAATGAEVLERAWQDCPSASMTYAHAREVLTSSTPEKVIDAYLDAFTAVAAHSRAKGGRTAGVRRLLTRT